jgi:hypothetical protein
MCGCWVFGGRIRPIGRAYSVHPPGCLVGHLSAVTARSQTINRSTTQDVSEDAARKVAIRTVLPYGQIIPQSLRKWGHENGEEWALLEAWQHFVGAIRNVCVLETNAV